MKTLIVCLAGLALAGCAGKPVPSWKLDAAASLAAFSEAWLKGDSAAADAEFARARSQTASTGRPDLVAHAELVRCATRVAGLEFDECPGFAALAQDASPAERAYAAYLGGRWQGLDAALLPAQHRAIVGVGANAPAAGKSVLAAIDEPLSRLVAAGALFRAGRVTPFDIALALDTASGQGWRRPLLMWLGVAEKRAEAAGDSAQAARIRRRIELASKVAP